MKEEQIIQVGRRTSPHSNYPELTDGLLEIGLKAVGYYDNKDKNKTKKYHRALMDDLYNAACWVKEGWPTEFCFNDIEYRIEDFDGDEEAMAKTMKYNSKVMDYISKVDFVSLLDIANDPLYVSSCLYTILMDDEEASNQDPSGDGNTETTCAKLGDQPEKEEGKGAVCKTANTETDESKDHKKDISNFAFSTGDSTPSERTNKKIHTSLPEGPIAAHNRKTDTVHPLLPIARPLKLDYKFLKAKKKLEGFKGLQRDKSYKPVEATKMRSYSDIRYISKTQFVKPGFEMKFAEKKFFVYNQGEIKEEKQTMFLLIDDSSSMNQEWKLSLVQAIIASRLEHVFLGKANLLISWFIGGADLERSVYINTKEKAAVYYKGLMEGKGMGNFGGGGTNIGHACNELGQAALKGKVGPHKLEEALKKPVLYVINDGNDHISEPEKVYPFTINAYVLVPDDQSVYSEQLKTLTKTNKGEYVQLTNN